MSKMFEQVVKNLLKESDDEYTFLKKVKAENPTLYSKFYSIIKNKGLDAAKQKYNEFDPELIKQRQKNQKKLDKQLSKIESQAKAHSELNEFVTVYNEMLKKNSIGKELIKIFNESDRKYLNLDGYKTKNLLNDLYTKDPNTLRNYVEHGVDIHTEKIYLYNKTRQKYEGYSDNIIVDVFFMPSAHNFKFNIKMNLGFDEFGNSMIDRIVNALKDKWNGFKQEDMDIDKTLTIFVDFIEDFSKDNVQNILNKFLAKNN